MAKTKKVTKKNRLEKAKSVVKKINNDLIDASFNAIENSVKAGEKWQKLTSKLIKKSEPLTKKQIGMFVETAENLKQQADFGLTRLKKLVGYDATMLDDAKKMITENPMLKKAEKMVTKLKKEVSENPLVIKAEKLTNTIKKEAIETYEEIAETFEEIKGKAGHIVEDVKEKVEDYTDEAKEKVENFIKTDKKVVAKKVVEKNTKKVTVATKKNDDLKVIKGIGPKMETVLTKNGISSFKKLAKLSVNALNELLTKEGVNIKRYDTSAWVASAKKL